MARKGRHAVALPQDAASLLMAARELGIPPRGVVEEAARRLVESAAGSPPREARRTTLSVPPGAAENPLQLEQAFQRAVDEALRGQPLRIAQPPPGPRVAVWLRTPRGWRALKAAAAEAGVPLSWVVLAHLRSGREDIR